MLPSATDQYWFSDDNKNFKIYKKYKKQKSLIRKFGTYAILILLGDIPQNFVKSFIKIYIAFIAFYKFLA